MLVSEDAADRQIWMTAVGMPIMATVRISTQLGRHGDAHGRQRDIGIQHPDAGGVHNVVRRLGQQRQLYNGPAGGISPRMRVEECA